MNHRFLMRLVTNLAVVLLTLSCFGTVLWVIDEILRWDILPDGWSLLIRALLVAGGIVTFVLVMMNLLLSLALLAESNASRAGLPDYGLSQRLKRRVRRSLLAGIVAIALLIGGLQITDHLRAQAATREARAEFAQAQTDLETSMTEVLSLFTPSLLAAIDSNTLAESQLGNLSKLLSSIKSSFPHSPNTTLLVPAAQPPFKYARINSSSIRASNGGRLLLAPELYATFPSEQETQAIEQLFAGEVPTLTEPLAGQVINNTLPGTWGVLKRDGRVIAVVYLQSELFYDLVPYGLPAFHHDGPDSLLSN
ncbi:MAG: hypothetical protein WBB01_20735 [Phormidesmis sp.]